MSYRSRLYNHRNAQSTEVNDKPFFSKQHEGKSAQQKGTFFQPKLSVNKPGDQYEQEADNVANAVVNNKAATPVLQQKKISSVQRLSTPMEDEKLGTNDARMEKDKEIQEKPIQRTATDPEKEKMKGIQKMEMPEEKKKKDIQKKDDPEKEKMKGIQKKDQPMKEEEDKMKTTAVQTKQNAGANTAPVHVSSKIESSAGKGNALPKNTLHEMSGSFGTDFSNVHIHNDSEAAGMNKELQAQAFTHGSDIYFNEGKYNPESSDGKFLLAHELTHVVQQNETLQEMSVQRRVIDSHVVTNQNTLDTLGLSRQEIVDAITTADADAIVLAQNAEDVLTAQLANARNGDEVDANIELILNEELGLSFNNPAHRGLISQQIRRFRTVKETLQSGYLRYLALGIGNVSLIGCTPGNCGEDFAFSCPGNRLIVLCQTFWDNADQQSATVLHEPFHIWFDMARHDNGALRRADASCFESFALRASGRSAFASCDAHTAG